MTYRLQRCTENSTINEFFCKTIPYFIILIVKFCSQLYYTKFTHTCIISTAHTGVGVCTLGNTFCIEI